MTLGTFHIPQEKQGAIDEEKGNKVKACSINTYHLLQVQLEWFV